MSSGVSLVFLLVVLVVGLLSYVLLVIFFTLIEVLTGQRGTDTIRISKVKGDADDEMVRLDIRLVMILRIGLLILVGEGFKSWLSIFVGLVLTAACSFWYPLIMDLHRFSIAIGRALVNEDGHSATALHPTVWSEGGLPKRRKVFQSAWEYAWVLGPLGRWASRFGWLAWCWGYCCGC